jgi:hypothetical protein
LVSQVFVVGGLVVMFNVSSSQQGIQGIEAKKKAKMELPSNLDDLKDQAKNKKQIDTVDAEKDAQGGNKVQGF